MAGPRIKLSSFKNEIAKGAFGAISKSRITLNTKVIAKFKDPDSAVGRYVNERRKESSIIARTFYSGMLTTVGSILKDPSAATNGALKSRPLDRKIVSFNTNVRMRTQISSTQARYNNIRLPLESGRLTFAPWKELPTDYVAVVDPKRYKKGTGTRVIAEQNRGALREPYGKWKGLPRSETIWRKTGRTYKAYMAKMNEDWGAVNASKRYGMAKPAKFMKKANNAKEIFSVRFDIEYPPLGSNALNRILRASFASGAAKRYGVSKQYLGLNMGPGGGPKGAERLAYPEFRRPMLARLAAAAGRENRKAINDYFKSRK